MRVDRVLRVVQVSFPQVYRACHTRHQRKRSTEHRLSARDATILAHLSESDGIAPSKLAAHLGIARSTLSEALKRLIALGYARGGDASSNGSGRMTPVFLTAKGARAIGDTSVLETTRLRAALDGLPASDLRVIAAGMARLAAACRNLNDSERWSSR